MKLEKRPLSAFAPKKPSNELKQRVLNAATGIEPEPVIYETLLNKLDWGLLAASFLLVAVLAFIGSGKSSSSSGAVVPNPELSRNDRYILEELEITAMPKPKALPKRIVAEQYLKEIGG